MKIKNNDDEELKGINSNKDIPIKINPNFVPKVNNFLTK